jgi:hypothetical protein
MSISLPFSATAVPPPAFTPRRATVVPEAPTDDAATARLHRLVSPRRSDLAAVVVYGENASLQSAALGQRLDLFV